MKKHGKSKNICQKWNKKKTKIFFPAVIPWIWNNTHVYIHFIYKLLLKNKQFFRMRILDIEKKYGGFLFEWFMKRIDIIQIWLEETF